MPAQGTPTSVPQLSGGRAPLFCDTALAGRIERVEAQLIAESSEAARRRAGTGGFVIPIAGGVASFAGEGSPFNKVAGLGFGGVPDAAALEEIEQAFAACGSPVQVELAHLADSAIGELLTGRGYRLESFENVRPTSDEESTDPMTAQPWPAKLPVRHVRIARPTDRLDEVTRFYCEGLGLPEIDRFAGHAGYRGVMVGLPGMTYHLEFTQHYHGSPGLAPSRDNLLVLYFDGRAQVEQVAARLAGLGHLPVEAENPYWTNNGAITIEDPDHWRVVLMPQSSV